jgi:hypothetical protein
MRTTKAMTNLVMMPPSEKPIATDKFGMSSRPRSSQRKVFTGPHVP